MYLSNTIIQTADQALTAWISTVLVQPPALPTRINKSITPPIPAKIQPPKPIKPTIPDRLYLTLEALKPTLINNGALEYRQNEPDRRPYWRLRYYDTSAGIRIRRSVRIGSDDNVACAVECWLEKIRAEERHRRTQERQARREERLELRRQRLYLAIATPGGRKLKRWVWATYKALEDRPLERLAFVLSVPFLTRPKMGRPLKGIRKEDVGMWMETVTWDTVQKTMPR